MRGYQPLESHRLCAVALASGVAALAATFTTVLNRGDHAIFSDTTYIAAYRLLNQILPEKYGVETSLVDTSDPQNVRDAIRPNTKLVHIETPANPTLKVSDIATIAGIAHTAGALLSVDNTFNSPFNVRPADLGADIVIESLTKSSTGMATHKELRPDPLHVSGELRRHHLAVQRMAHQPRLGHAAAAHEAA